MKPFRYERAATAEAAVAVATEHGDGAVRYLAGGTNLVDLMKLGVETPGVLVDVDALGLSGVEMEVETAIARTSRSPMIRDAHDFRAGIHDRQLRKLTGRT